MFARQLHSISLTSSREQYAFHSITKTVNEISTMSRSMAALESKLRVRPVAAGDTSVAAAWSQLEAYIKCSTVCFVAKSLQFTVRFTAIRGLMLQLPDRL